VDAVASYAIQRRHLAPLPFDAMKEFFQSVARRGGK